MSSLLFPWPVCSAGCEADVPPPFRSVMQDDFPKSLASHRSLEQCALFAVAPAVTAEWCRMVFKILFISLMFSDPPKKLQHLAVGLFNVRGEGERLNYLKRKRSGVDLGEVGCVAVVSPVLGSEETQGL